MAEQTTDRALVRFEAEGQERLVTAWEKAAKAAQVAAGAVERFENVSKKGAASAAGGFGAVGTALLALKGPLGAVTAAAKVVMDTVGSLAKAVLYGLKWIWERLEDIAGAVWNLATRMAKAAGIIGAAWAAAVGLVAAAGIDMRLTATRATIAISKMLGSRAMGEGFISDLRAEARTSALTFKDLLPVSQQLVAAYGPSGLGKVIPTIRAFGDAAVMLGADVAAQERALLGFRQLLMSPKGPIMQDLRQISENLAGFDLYGALRKAFGTSDTEALQRAKVTGKQAADVIIKAMEENFGGAQKVMSKQLPIIVSNWRDAFNEIAGSITGGLLTALTKAADRILGVLDNISQNKAILQALSIPMTIIGNSILYLTEKLMGLKGSFEALISSGKWATFWGRVAEGVRVFLGYMGAAIDWVGANWPKVWGAVSGFIVNAIDWIVRATKGLIGVWDYLTGPVAGKLIKTLQSDISTAVITAVNWFITFSNKVNRYMAYARVAVFGFAAAVLMSMSGASAIITLTAQTFLKAIEAIGSAMSRIPATAGFGQGLVDAAKSARGFLVNATADLMKASDAARKGFGQALADAGKPDAKLIDINVIAGKFKASPFGQLLEGATDAFKQGFGSSGMPGWLSGVAPAAVNLLSPLADALPPAVKPLSPDAAAASKATGNALESAISKVIGGGEEARRAIGGWRLSSRGGTGRPSFDVKIRFEGTGNLQTDLEKAIESGIKQIIEQMIRHTATVGAG